MKIPLALLKIADYFPLEISKGTFFCGVYGGISVAYTVFLTL